MVRETWIRSINDNASKSQTLLVTTEKEFFLAHLFGQGCYLKSICIDNVNLTGMIFQNPCPIAVDEEIHRQACPSHCNLEK